MTDETTAPDNQGDETTGAAEGKSFDPRILIAGLMGGASPRGIHEIGVQGSVIEQTYEFLQSHMKVEPGVITTPDGAEAPIVITQTGVHVLKPEEFDSWRIEPMRRKGTASLYDLDSLIAHAKRFADDDSVVFANNDRANPSMTVVLDYHRKDVGDLVGAPRWGQHRGTFKFPLSDEWKSWHQYDGKQMDQATFARFLEDHIVDVMASGFFNLNDDQREYVERLGGEAKIADPAKLMEIASRFQILERNETAQAVRLDTGETEMVFTSQHEDIAGGRVVFPSLFVIGIPVLVNGPAYQVLARLRYRSNGQGKLVFWYELWRTDRVFDHAFDEAVKQVKAETGLPVLLGSPE